MHRLGLAGLQRVFENAHAIVVELRRVERGRDGHRVARGPGLREDSRRRDGTDDDPGEKSSGSSHDSSESQRLRSDPGGRRACDLDNNRSELAPRSSSVPHRIATSPALWLTLIFSLLTVALTWPVARVLATGVPGDYGDPLFIAWVMSWVADKVTAALTNPLALRGFWDAPIFHPETGALAFSEHFIPQTVLILPVYWLTHNPILSYNIAFLTSYVLTGLGTALLTRALSGSLAAAVLAGVVAAFNEYRLVWEVAHLQTLSIYWFPFVLYGIDRYFATGRRQGLVLAGLSWAALNLSSVYYLAYCAPFIVAFVVIELLRYRASPRRPHVARSDRGGRRCRGDHAAVSVALRGDATANGIRANPARGHHPLGDARQLPRRTAPPRRTAGVWWPRSSHEPDRRDPPPVRC